MVGRLCADVIPLFLMGETIHYSTDIVEVTKLCWVCVDPVFSCQICMFLIFTSKYLIIILFYQVLRLDWIWNSSDSIMPGYRLDSWGLIPGRGKIFLFSIVSLHSLEPTQPPIQRGKGAHSPGVKPAGA
jgi:hypothetical protein